MIIHTFEHDKSYNTIIEQLTNKLAERECIYKGKRFAEMGIQTHITKANKQCSYVNMFMLPLITLQLQAKLSPQAKIIDTFELILTTHKPTG